MSWVFYYCKANCFKFILIICIIMGWNFLVVLLRFETNPNKFEQWDRHSGLLTFLKMSKYCWYRVKYCLTGMNEYTRSNAHTQILRTVKDFPRILSSWTRKSRNGVHFPESSAERFTFFTSLRSSGPFLTAFPRILKLNSGSQGRRPFQQTSARLVPSPLRCLFPMIRPWAFALVSWF